MTTKRERLETVVLPLMQCIRCKRSDLALHAQALECRACGASYRVHQDIPIMTDDPDAAVQVAPEVVVENSYSEQWLELLKRAGDGLVLDLGSGNNPNPAPRLIKLDIFAMPNVDVVGMAEALPFRDGAFRTVMSGAVFEHVQNPFESIAQVRRVLADGGDVYIETAFLQPVHAFPSHYFNMTRMGLEYVCRSFKRLDAGVQPHQNPSFALAWFLEVMAGKLPPAARADFLMSRVGDVLEEFKTNAFSKRWIEHFSPSDLEQMACGVYFYGRKTDGDPGPVPPLPSPKPPPWRKRPSLLARVLQALRRRLGQALAARSA